MQIEPLIISKLRTALSPEVLEVINESHRHSVPPNSETHFKVTIVSQAFAGLRAVQRHQQVYGILAEELAGPVHALALHTYTPKEWSKQPSVSDSPNCMGGSKTASE